MSFHFQGVTSAVDNPLSSRDKINVSTGKYYLILIYTIVNFFMLENKLYSYFFLSVEIVVKRNSYELDDNGESACESTEPELKQDEISKEVSLPHVRSLRLHYSITFGLPISILRSVIS